MTLIEVLVILVLLGVLVALLIPSYTSGPISPHLKCVNNLRFLGMALTEYSTYFGRYPDADGNGQADTGRALFLALREARSPGTKKPFLDGSDELFVCPGSGMSPGPGVVSYFGPNYPLTDDIGPDTPVARDRDGDHGGTGIVVLYKSTRVQFVPIPSPEFEAARRATKEE